MDNRKIREEAGVVVKTWEGFALIEIAPEGSCEGCGAREICRLGMSGKREIEVMNLKNAKVGDRVRIAIELQKSLLASFLLYILPIITFFIGVGIGQWIWKREGASTICGFIGFFGIFISFKIFGKKIRKRFLPFITEIMSS